jgi:O-antigen ligase
MAGILIPLAVGLYGKVQWLAQSFSVATLLDRVDIWGKTINLLKGYHAIAGLGLGNWFDVYKSHYGRVVIHVHNNYLQLYTDIGILGALALIAALVIFMRHSTDILSASRHDSWYGVGVGLIGSIIAGAVFAFFDVTTTATVVTATGYIYLSIPLLWVLAALLVVSKRRLCLPK